MSQREMGNGSIAPCWHPVTLTQKPKICQSCEQATSGDAPTFLFVIPAHLFVIPDVFNRGPRAFTWSCLSVFLDAGSWSGMTTGSLWFSVCRVASGMTTGSHTPSFPQGPLRTPHAPIVIPAKAGIQGLCFQSSGCRIERGMGKVCRWLTPVRFRNKIVVWLETAVSRHERVFSNAGVAQW